MMGPVISSSSLQRVTRMVANSTRPVATGGHRLNGLSPLDEHDLSKGHYFAPTVITDVETSDELWQEEAFGPVVVVKRFKV